MARASKAAKKAKPANTTQQPTPGCPMQALAQTAGNLLPDVALPSAGPTSLTMYKAHQEAAPVRPAQRQRDWMDDTRNRWAYRCLPLSIANATGWEMTLLAGFRAFWNGGPEPSDMRVEPLDKADEARMPSIASSHFGSGVLTMHTGYLMRTSPGWGLWVRGAPNCRKDGIVALDGLIETDWLPFPFFMNWGFTRPGMVEFEKGEVFCFITPTPHHALEEVTPSIVPLETNPALMAAMASWGDLRNASNEARNDPEKADAGWQRLYMQGKMPDGEKVELKHASKRIMKAPVTG